MQNIFKELVPEHIYNDARNLVEYCCFRFLSRDASYFHRCLKVCLDELLMIHSSFVS